MIVAKDGISGNDVSSVIKNWEQIEKACAINQFEPTRKRMRNDKIKVIEVALLKWIREVINTNLIWWDIILQKKQKFLHKLMVLKNLHAQMNGC